MHRISPRKLKDVAKEIADQDWEDMAYRARVNTEIRLMTEGDA